METLKVAPYMLAKTPDLTKFEGFLKVGGASFMLSIELSQPGNLRGAQVSGEARLVSLLRGHEAIVEQLLQQCPSVSSFLVELTRLLERLDLSSCNKNTDQGNHVSCEKLVEEIGSLGWERLSYIDEGFRKLHLQTTDSRGRNHILRAHLPSQYPVKGPDCEAETPRPFEFLWNPETSNLSSLYEQFVSHVSRFSYIWDQLDELDKETWILEPENPSRAATYRRIALGNNASVQITIHPDQPTNLPEINFLGADHVVGPLKESLHDKVNEWDPSLSLLQNLKTILSFKFPSKTDMTKEELHAECGICYAYRLEGHIPDQQCENVQCKQAFHQTCLFEWLHSLPSSRQSFNTVFGECPYCNKGTSVKMPLG